MEGNVLLVLKENPHYRYENCKEEIEKKGKNIRISYETYEKAREKLIQNLREKIFQKTDSALNKRILLALLIHKPLKNITLREAETTLRQMAETKFSDMEK